MTVSDGDRIMSIEGEKKSMKRLFRKGKENRASITVEAATSLLLFTFVMLFLLSFIDISRAQAKIQNAVDKAALEISEYMYLYQAFGLYNLDAAMNSAGSSAEDALDNMVSSADDGILGVETIFSSLQDTVDSVKKGDRLTKDELVKKYREISGEGSNITASYEAIKNEFSGIKDDPIGFAKSLGAMGVSFGMDKLKSFVIGSVLAKNMTVKYIGAYYSEDEKDKDPDYEKIADARLKSWGIEDGIEGLDFRCSNIFSKDSPQDINIVVTYKVNVFKLLGDFTLTYAQSASTQAWLGGDCTAEIAQNERAQLPPAAEGGSLEDTLPTSAPTPTPTPGGTPTPEGTPTPTPTPEVDEREKMEKATMSYAKNALLANGYYWKDASPADGMHWDLRYDFTNTLFEAYGDINMGRYAFYTVNEKNEITGIRIISTELFTSTNGIGLADTEEEKAKAIERYQESLKKDICYNLPEAGSEITIFNGTSLVTVKMPDYTSVPIQHDYIVSEETMNTVKENGIVINEKMEPNQYITFRTQKDILGE